jgi:RNA polymerase sigma-70 factor (ECF subfamily)
MSATAAERRPAKFHPVEKPSGRAKRHLGWVGLLLSDRGVVRLEDREAFCAEMFPRLVGSLGLYTGDADLAQELAQDALARALLHWDRVTRAASPAAYVHGIAVNLAGSHFRRLRTAARARSRHGEAERIHRDPDTANVLAVRNAVARLPRRQRQIVVLRYQGQFTLPEIAETLGITTGAVKALNHRASKALREMLDSEEDSHVR